MPLPSNPNQVLIVGGGPAGTSTAWHLAKAGIDVTLLDRAHFPRAKPCSEYISPEGARILDAMGALQTLERSHSAALTGMRVHAPSGDVIHGDFIAAHGYRSFRDRGMGVRREVLDTLLVECARNAGVRVIEGAKVESLLRYGGRSEGAVVSGADASAVDAAGGELGAVCGARVRYDGQLHDVRASMVVGADGLRSVVARRLGLARASRWPRRFAIVAHYDGVRDIGSLGEMHVTRAGYLGLADVGDNITNVALVVPKKFAGAMRGDPLAFLTAWIAARPELASRFGSARLVSPVQVTGPFASHATRAWSPGAALVGDAADFFDPFTGEGIFAALRGGELAAPYIAEATIARREGQAQQSNRVLAAYERERRATFAGKWRVERLIGTAVGAPALMNYAARVMGRDKGLADLLVGVTGDFVPASALLAPRTLLRFLWPRRSTPALPATTVHAHR